MLITHNLNILANQLIAMPKIVEMNATNMVRKMALTLASGVIKATPVDTGLARGNWQVSLRSPINTEISSKSGQESINKAKTVSLQFTLKDKSIWICNNLPYINALNNGWSKQANAGFIERQAEGVHFDISNDKLYH